LKCESWHKAAEMGTSTLVTLERVLSEYKKI